MPLYRGSFILPILTSLATQSRVNQAISELNFDASGMFKVRNITHHNNKILVIDNQLVSNSLINQGIESKAKALGYKLLYLRFLYFSQQDIQQIISYTINHQLDGILIINDSPYIQSLLQCQNALPPIVLVNQFLLQLPCVYFDHLSIAYQATQYLITQQHKRIAILLGNMNKMEVYQLKNGYMQALSRANITVATDYIIYRCFDYQTSRNVVKNLINLANPPTAIICTDHLGLNCSDRETLSSHNKFCEAISSESSICGVIDQCRELNINIPKDLSLLQFIHSKSHKQYHSLNYISAVYKPLFQMGEQAVELLVSLLSE